MPKKQSFLTASVITFAFVFAAITHACSTPLSVSSAVQKTSVDMASSADSTCREKRALDVCEFVRQALLSVKPSAPWISTAEEMIPSPAISLTVQPFVASVPVMVVNSVSFHPVFKLPLRLSYLVLRI